MCSNKSRKVYKEIHNRRAGFKSQSNWCRDKEGNLKTSNEEVLQIWKCYFTEPLNKYDESFNLADHTIYCRIMRVDIIEELMYNEVVNNLSYFKNNKLPGKNIIPIIPFWVIHKWCKEIWKQEKICMELKVGIICPIYRKEDWNICNN